MSWMTKRRAAFSPAGPFIAQRSGAVGNMEFVFGETVTAAQLAEAGIDRRRLELLYSGHWMNMVPEGEPIVLDVDPAEGDGTLQPRTLEPGEMLAEGTPPEGLTGERIELPTPPEAPQVAIAYRAVGFGKYQAVDAAGAVFGKRVSKVIAEQSTLPIQPQQKG